MSEWQNKSNFEINKAVAEYLGFGLDSGYGFVDIEGNLVCYDVIRKTGDETRAVEVRVNYCKNPSDAWPIITGNKIDLTFAVESLGGIGQAQVYIEGDTDIFCEFTNNNKALRAAMIVFLEMNGVKP